MSPNTHKPKNRGGSLSLDFINTIDCRNGDRPHDNLTKYSDIVSWSTHTHIINEDEAEDLLATANLNPTEAQTVLARAITLREALYRIFSAISRYQPVDNADLATLNKEMTMAITQMHLKPETPPQPWKYVFERKSLDHMLWQITCSATELLVSDRLDRIRECQGENCGWLFIDMSRNRTRKWCDMKDCGNIAKARRHYQTRHGKRI